MSGWTLAPLDDEVDEALEGLALALAIRAPERLELRLAGLDRYEPEQVLKPVLEERVALHVEEDVARPRAGEEGKAAFRLRRE